MLLVAKQNKLEHFRMDFFGNKAKEARVFFSGCEYGKSGPVGNISWALLLWTILK